MAIRPTGSTLQTQPPLQITIGSSDNQQIAQGGPRGNEGPDAQRRNEGPRGPRGPRGNEGPGGPREGTTLTALVGSPDVVTNALKTLNPEVGNEVDTTV